jgi:RNA ligase (TIGR02306 family)
MAKTMNNVESINKLATIESIWNIRPHPNADSLELANVKGWQVVVPKNKYQNHELVVFISIDSILPICEWSRFLVDPKKPDVKPRIKTVRLRGEYSQGLVLSINECQLFNLPEGMDVTSYLGVEKYVKPLPACLAGEALGGFPSHIAPKTDEILLQNEPGLLKELEGVDCYWALKWDGSSCTFAVDSTGQFLVASRNLNLKDNKSNSFWSVAHKLGLPGSMLLLGSSRFAPLNSMNWAIQGELAGPGIQQNTAKLPELTFMAFSLYRNRTRQSIAELMEICADLNIKCVEPNFLSSKDAPKSIEDWQALADSARYPCGSPAEGIVVRPATDVNSKILLGPLSFKVINRNYKD